MIDLNLGLENLWLLRIPFPYFQPIYHLYLCSCLLSWVGSRRVGAAAGGGGGADAQERAAAVRRAVYSPCKIELGHLIERVRVRYTTNKNETDFATLSSLGESEGAHGLVLVLRLDDVPDLIRGAHVLDELEKLHEDPRQSPVASVGHPDFLSLLRDNLANCRVVHEADGGE